MVVFLLLISNVSYNLFIHRLLYGSHCKWKNFAMYWLKLDLREYLSQDVVLNSSLDSIEKPVFYANALAAFKDLSKLDKSFDLKSDF